jgi:hypothetical protein
MSPYTDATMCTTSLRYKGGTKECRRTPTPQCLQQVCGIKEVHRNVAVHRRHNVYNKFKE